MNATTNTAPNRSQRCSKCPGCQCKPCGICIHCQDSPAFGGPGVKKQSCIERRCRRVLENRLQKEVPTFKARVGCNDCDDCRKADCQECLVCLDKRFFDNRYMKGAICSRNRCYDATPLLLPSQQQQQQQNCQQQQNSTREMMVDDVTRHNSYNVFMTRFPGMEMSQAVFRNPLPATFALIGQTNFQQTMVQHLSPPTSNIPNSTAQQLQTINLYDKKYPVLSKMLKFYSKFSKFRSDSFNLNTYNWKLCSDLNVFGKENGSKMFQDFEYLTELSGNDRCLLLNHFWTPFWFFERICDTLVTFDATVNGNFVILQDKSIQNLSTLIIENNFVEQKELIYGYWNSVLKLLSMLKPDILEIMYIFCFILLNYNYLDVGLTEDGEEMVRRVRLIVNQELREFYQYDDIRWQRIYLLQNILVLTENVAKEFKKVSSVAS